MSGAVVILAIAVVAAGCSGSGARGPAPFRARTASAQQSAPAQPTSAQSMSAQPTSSQSTSQPAGYPTQLHKPASGEHWQAGRALALPCPQRGPVSTNTLLRDGPLKTRLEHYTKPEIVLRPGGRIDLSDGVLGVAGGDYVSAADNASSPEETTYTTVPKGVGVVTIARFLDAADASESRASDFAAAELRLSDTQPVRWERHGYAGTDIATAAWFGKAARERFAATGYEPFADPDDQGRDETDVTSAWDIHCHFFDVAPREIDGVHDVILIITEGDGGFPQYVGYDASGRAAAAVLLGYVPWAGLGLPGTPPPGVR